MSIMRPDSKHLGNLYAPHSHANYALTFTCFCLASACKEALSGTAGYTLINEHVQGTCWRHTVSEPLHSTQRFPMIKQQTNNKQQKSKPKINGATISCMGRCKSSDKQGANGLAVNA
eukprot:1146063-Pelagomonas_calceolata.AAC.21